jgi:hypothetical protein
MSPDKEICDYFAEGENLETAIELSRDLDVFIKDLHKKFWFSFNSQMDRRLVDGNYLWKFRKFNTSAILTAYAKSYIEPVHRETKEAPFVRFFWGQQGSDGGYQLYKGVVWNKDPKSMSEAPSVLPLTAALVKMGITTDEKDPAWIRWCRHGEALYSPEMLKNLYKDTDGTVKHIVDDVMNQFLVLKPFMEKVNEEAETSLD